MVWNRFDSDFGPKTIEKLRNMRHMAHAVFEMKKFIHWRNGSALGSGTGNVVFSRSVGGHAFNF